MKTIEQKARAYDDVIRKLRGMMPNWERLSYNGKTFLQDLIYIIPELAESEDEKVRKEIVNYFQCQSEEEPTRKEIHDKWINWLEKQAERKTPQWMIDFLDDYRRKIGCSLDHDEARDVDGKILCIMQWLENQGTPAKLSEEEQNKFAKVVLRSCAMSFIDYLDAHKYEGKMCVSNGECEDIENAFHNAMWDRLHRYYCKYIEKQGEQKPAEWSEEDETYIEHIITAVKNYYTDYKGKENPFRKPILDFLKSLKERYTWRPSDEQMDALHYVTNFDYGGHKATLVSLYEQLKKLKE